MELQDWLRLLVFMFTGVAAGFAIATNFLAYKVLRPPKRLGFLWWHVTAITTAFFLWASVILDNALNRLGEDLTWRSGVSLAGAMLFATAQVIIFNVERARWQSKKLEEKLTSHGT